MGAQRRITGKRHMTERNRKARLPHSALGKLDSGADDFLHRLML